MILYIASTRQEILPLELGDLPYFFGDGKGSYGMIKEYSNTLVEIFTIQYDYDFSNWSMSSHIWNKNEPIHHKLTSSDRESWEYAYGELLKYIEKGRL